MEKKPVNPLKKKVEDGKKKLSDASALINLNKDIYSEEKFLSFFDPSKATYWNNQLKGKGKKQGPILIDNLKKCCEVIIKNANRKGLGSVIQAMKAGGLEEGMDTGERLTVKNQLGAQKDTLIAIGLIKNKSGIKSLKIKTKGDLVKLNKKIKKRVRKKNKEAKEQTQRYKNMKILIASLKEKAQIQERETEKAREIYDAKKKSLDEHNAMLKKDHKEKTEAYIASKTAHEDWKARTKKYGIDLKKYNAYIKDIALWNKEKNQFDIDTEKYKTYLKEMKEYKVLLAKFEEYERKLKELSAGERIVEKRLLHDLKVDSRKIPPQVK